MDDQTACDIANKVVHDTSFYIALVGSLVPRLGRCSPF